jgi:hypothetical protein
LIRYTDGVRAYGLALVAALGMGSVVAATEIPEAQIILDVFESARPGWVPEAAPVRLAVFEDGRLFVGGTSELQAGQLDKRELGELDKRVSLVRKQAPASNVTFGPGETRYRLRLGKDHPQEILASGDPAQAPAALQALARLVSDLAAFEHPSLRPWRAAACLATAIEQALPGGCRTWTLAVPLSELHSARTIPTDQLSGWPLGAIAASACGPNGHRYAVTFHPLLPGER